MKRLARPRRRALLAACGCAAALLAAVPVAMADDIPRPPGAIDNRGYELVSLPDKDRNPMSLVSAPTDDGGRIVYSISGSTPDSSTGGLPVYTASRTSAGWVSKYDLPPTPDLLGTAYFVSAATPDLTRLVATAFIGIGNNIGSPDLSVVTLDGAGGQTLLHTFPTAFASSGVNAMASDDLGHIYVLVAADSDPLLPGVVSGADLVYDLGGGTPQLVSRMPGTDQAPLCGTPSGEDGFAYELYQQSEHWASTDGRRVFFATRGDNCSDPIQLYMRDVVAGTTTQISTSPLGPDNGIQRFLQATPDGSQVFYETTTSYDPADSADGDDNDMDVYRWSAATGQNVCVTCGVPNADVLDSAIVSEDGSHVYFTSANRLADAPSAADESNPNTYVWRLGRPSIRFIARTDGLTNLAKTGTYVTPNGNALLFTSAYPGLDALTDGSNGGFSEIYRYDDSDGTVTCVSCPRGGVSTSNVPFGLVRANQSVMADARPMSDDGSIVVFGTNDALVPQDVNGGRDLYEWHNGIVQLITGGRTVYPNTVGPVLVSLTPDGHDVFFTDLARLTSDAQDDAQKLYDARVDGGFPPAPTPPSPCHGDCRGPIMSAPSLPAPGSAVTGPGGNASPGSPGRFTIARISARQRAAFAKRGTIVLSVRVSERGSLEAFATATFGGQARTVGGASATARRAGTVTLRLRLSRAARRELARKGRLRVAIDVAFGSAPDGRRLVLALAAPKGGGASRAARKATVRATVNGR